MVDSSAAQQAKGVVDVLHGFLHAKTPEDAAGLLDPSRGLNEHRIELRVEPPPLPAVQGALWLMPSGPRDGYEERLAEARLASSEFEAVRKPFSLWFRKALVASQAFDYLFIDARTGFSDEGYIAAKFMCDYLVIVTGLNDQNLEGTAEFLRKLAAWKEEGEGEGYGPKKAVLVAGNVCEYEDDLKQKRFKEAERIFAEVAGPGIGFSVALPYHPRLSLSEELIGARWPDSGLGRAYRQLMRVLRELNDDGMADWANRAAKALAEKRHEECAEAIEQAAAIDFREAGNLARTLAGAIGRATREEAPKAISLLERLSALDPDEPLYPVTLLTTLVERGQALEDSNPEISRKAYQEAVRIARDLGDRRNLCVALHRLAVVDRMQGNYALARRGYEESLGIFRDLGDRRGIAATLYGLAELDFLQGDYASTRPGYEQSLRIARDLGNRRGIAATLHGRAESDHLEGNYASACQGYEESLEIFRSLGDRWGIVFVETYLAATTAQANPQQSLSELDAAAERALAWPDPYVGAKACLLRGEVLRQRGNNAQALNALNAGLERAGVHGLRGLAADINAERALCLRGLGRLNEAGQAARAALAFFEEQLVRSPSLEALKSLAKDQ